MAARPSIKSNLYKDSVSLMRTSQLTVKRCGVRSATLLMGTAGNKEFLSQAALMSAALESANPGDIMVVVEDDSTEKLEAAEREIESLIAGDAPDDGPVGTHSKDVPTLRSVCAGVAAEKHVVLALISVPGSYAGAEALGDGVPSSRSRDDQGSASDGYIGPSSHGHRRS